MGWFWGSSSNDDKKPASSSSSSDPLRDLDPGLRDFLKKESPIKYTTDSAQPPATPSAQPSEATPPPEAPAPAAPTLFADGRYAHLWKTYTPQSDVEAASKSDAEKIADVLEGYKYRKAEIGRAALENCALEQWEVNECFTNGGVRSRLTMCRTESRSLERCVEMQQKFLKALGYLSTFEREKEVEERIQMHADTLYHRMLEQERAVEEAKKEGRMEPKFTPLLAGSVAVPAPKHAPSTAIPAAAEQAATEAEGSKLAPAIQSQIKEKLEGLSGIERELQEKALMAEVAAGQEVKANLKDIYKDAEEERRKRREEGRETIVDRFSTIFGGAQK
jgi:hypothetical protein